MVDDLVNVQLIKQRVTILEFKSVFSQLKRNTLMLSIPWIPML